MFHAPIRANYILSLICLLAVSGCANRHVSYDYDPTIDFVGFKSYRWLKQDQAGKTDPRVDNDLLDARIRKAINNTLQQKRYIASESGKVDFLVTYKIGIEKRTDVDTVRTGIGFGYRYFDLGFGTETIVREYDQVTLFIDVIDPVSKKLIWRGMRDYRYQKGADVAKRNLRINEIVLEILSGFPPPKTS